MVIDVSVIFPCLNEQASIGDCVRETRSVLSSFGKSFEVIVVDNNSTDNSAVIAAANGARVVFEKNRGYGSAYLAGLRTSSGKFVVMADPDRTYSLKEIPLFLKRLENSADFVIGNRFSLGEKNIPLLRKAGNISLNSVFEFLYNIGIFDLHCGFRAIKRSALEKISLSEQGFPFALELVLECVDKKLSIEQIDISYSKRVGSSKLHAVFDGFRHLKFVFARKAVKAIKGN